MAGRRKSIVAAVAIGLIAVMGLAGCGGDDGEDAEAPAASAALASKQAGASDTTTDAGATPTTEESSATSAGAVPAELEVTIGKTGWYRGFAVTVDAATVTAGFGTDVRLVVTYENLTEQTARPEDTAVIVDGERISHYADIPEVPGKGKAKGTIDFTLEESDLDAAGVDKAFEAVSLVYGEASDNQTKIPLGGSAKVESVEPKALAVTGQLLHAEMIVDVLGGTVAPSYESGEKGKTEINLKIKISCSAACSPSGYAIGRADFSVTGPDGLSAVADDRSAWCCDAIYPGTVSDSADNLVAFVVASPGTGAYTLTFASAGLVSRGIAPGTLTFTV